MHPAPTLLFTIVPFCVFLLLTVVPLIVCVPSPDWTFVEALGAGSYDFSASNPPTPEQLVKMYGCSPIAHVHRYVFTPLLPGIELVTPESKRTLQHLIEKNASSASTPGA